MFLEELRKKEWGFIWQLCDEIGFDIDQFIADNIGDNCEVCKGEKGGTRGNENVIDGVVTCDYCHAEQMEKR